jgi:tetratricopeptide (TPR) repeat protein
LSLAHLNLNENDLAQRYANDAIAADPLEEWGFRLRSIVLLRQGRKHESLEAAQEAVRLSPREPLALYSLAQAQRANQRIRDARQMAEKLREIAPDDPLAYESLALLAIDEERYDEAEGHCRKALALNPHSYAAMNNLGLTFLRRQHYREALEHFHQAAQLNPLGKTAQDNLRYTISKYVSPMPKVRFGYVVYFYVLAVIARASLGVPILALLVIVLGIGIILAMRHNRMRQLSPVVQSFVIEFRRRDRERAFQRFLLQGASILLWAVSAGFGLLAVIMSLVLILNRIKSASKMAILIPLCLFFWFVPIFLGKYVAPKLEARKAQQSDY